MNQRVRFQIGAVDAESLRQLLASKREEFSGLVARASEIDREIARQIRKARFWNNAAIVSLSVGLVVALVALALR